MAEAMTATGDPVCQFDGKLVIRYGIRLVETYLEGGADTDSIRRVLGRPVHGTRTLIIGS